MKKYIVTILTSVACSCGVFYGLNSFSEDKVKTYIEKPLSIGKPVVYTTNKNDDLVPLNFQDVAKDAMDAVVHIKSSVTEKRSVSYRNYQRLPDPFEHFFRDDFFNDFFGSPYQYKVQPRQAEPQVKVSTGSGVIVNSEGYIVTNNHVIKDADEIEVTLHDNRSYKAVVVGTDPTTDLALIQIKESELPVIPMINSDEVEVGEWVLAVGNPFNLNSTVTAGIVSAKARNINLLKEKGAIESFIQTDAAINPGNSGGALVSLSGGLIGINTAIASPTGAYSGYGFAVPSNIVNKVVEDLLKYGVVQRGFLGVMIKELNTELKEELDLEINEGIYVDSLLEDGAAKKSGIKEGDVINSVNQNKVTTVPMLQEFIGRQRPGDKVDLGIIRKGKQQNVEVVLHNSDGELDLLEKNEVEVFDVLGAYFKSLDKKTIKKLKISGGIKLDKLTAGKLRKQTDIREGCVITKVDNKEISSIEEFKKILSNKKGGVLLEGVYEDYPGTFYYAFGL